ncbi:MAG: hypothetical protein JWN76_1235 [Chitinophagaceae bacterium]|nr:hypothetical protein [Chitinophagaceae bacterium]
MKSLKAYYEAFDFALLVYTFAPTHHNEFLLILAGQQLSNALADSFPNYHQLKLMYA